MKEFGLIGFPLSHSWSGRFFSARFRKAGLDDYTYHLFPLPDLKQFPGFIREHPRLAGFNVTIPHKERILPFLDSLDCEAEEIGAVNTVLIRRNEDGVLLHGHNTDAGGFRQSADFSGYTQALVLGTGGSARAICHALKSLGITPILVSRHPVQPGILSYAELEPALFGESRLIINCTPCGMYPEIGSVPPIPYQWITPGHFLYDLVYNPDETVFLKKGAAKGARIQSGFAMLQIQAELAFRLFTGSPLQ
jgi:shikimate dehydrogenase